MDRKGNEINHSQFKLQESEKIWPKVVLLNSLSGKIDSFFKIINDVEVNFNNSLRLHYSKDTKLNGTKIPVYIFSLLTPKKNKVC